MYEAEELVNDESIAMPQTRTMPTVQITLETHFVKVAFQSNDYQYSLTIPDYLWGQLIDDLKGLDSTNIDHKYNKKYDLFISKFVFNCTFNELMTLVNEAKKDSLDLDILESKKVNKLFYTSISV